MNISAAVRSLVDWLRGALGSGETEARRPVVEDELPDAEPPVEDPSSFDPLPEADPMKEALAYLDQVRAKVSKLAEDFNAGSINRAQFRNLYVHYQRQIRSIESLIEGAPESDDWKDEVASGQSILIRRRHSARAIGYAIFENDSGMPLSTLGRFEFDPALLVPMLASYRSAAQEAFGAGSRSTEMEDGRWLCFVPGEFTTMLAVFTAEPAAKQLQFLGDLHQQFEQANRRHLMAPLGDVDELLFPHEYYLGEWRR